jgi:hypothetical protein
VLLPPRHDAVDRVAWRVCYMTDLARLMSELHSERKRGMSGATTPKDIAIHAIKGDSPNAQNIVFQNETTNFIGGTLYTMRFNTNGREEFWPVLVRDGVAKVYRDTFSVFPDVANYRPKRGLWEFLESQQGILGLLSLLIVIATLVAFFVERDATIVQFLQSPLSVVLGFWFGRGLPSRA